jgi:hypothetical protein
MAHWHYRCIWGYSQVWCQNSGLCLAHNYSQLFLWNSFDHMEITVAIAVVYLRGDSQRSQGPSHFNNRYAQAAARGEEPSMSSAQWNPRPPLGGYCGYWGSGGFLSHGRTPIAGGLISWKSPNKKWMISVPLWLRKPIIILYLYHSISYILKNHPQSAGKCSRHRFTEGAALQHISRCADLRSWDRRRPPETPGLQIDRSIQRAQFQMCRCVCCFESKIMLSFSGKALGKLKLW